MKKIYCILFVSFFCSISISCKYFESEESKVKEVSKAFMNGIRALENGDSLQLKSITGDTLYKLIILNHQYSKLLESSLGSPEDFYGEPQSVEIKGGKATCIIYEYYKLNLYKTKNSWKVNGENDKFGNVEQIAKTHKKINDYKEIVKEKPKKDPPFHVTNNFFADASVYFKNNDASRLKNNCNDATANFVKRLYTYAKKRSGSDVINEEANKPYSSTGEIKLEGDRATYQFYKESVSVLLQKSGNSYKVIGFNGIESKSINEQIMESQYLELLRAVRLLAPEQYRNKAIK